MQLQPDDSEVLRFAGDGLSGTKEDTDTAG